MFGIAENSKYNKIVVCHLFVAKLLDKYNHKNTFAGLNLEVMFMLAIHTYVKIFCN